MSPARRSDPRQRVRCNCCGERLPGKDQTAFLCRSCIGFAPVGLMLRYRRACNAVLRHRRTAGRFGTPLPYRLNAELAAAWRLTADAARAAYYAQQKDAA